MLIPITVVPAETLSAAWQWLVSSVSSRPSRPCGEFIFDHKSWNGGGCCGPLVPLKNVVCWVGSLYLASQLGDLDTIMQLVRSGVAEPVEWFVAKLDSDTASVVKSRPRFRNHLSEHLSFWVRLATEVRRSWSCAASPTHEFWHTRPNIQPEDKGPDGLFLSLESSEPHVEMLSVKNSTGNPQQEVSYARFRKSGQVDETLDRRPLLEGFWLSRHREIGLLRLDVELGSLCRQLGLGADKARRAALLIRASYNGVVVADEKYAQESLFAGFRHVHSDPGRCIGTYIGSQQWSVLAERIRRHIITVLEQKGLI